MFVRSCMFVERSKLPEGWAGIRQRGMGRLEEKSVIQQHGIRVACSGGRSQSNIAGQQLNRDKTS